MSRDLPELLAADLASPNRRPFLAVHMALADPVSAWTGLGPLSFGGRTYLGTGRFGSIEPAGESDDGGAGGLRLTLGGIPPAMEADIMEQAYRGATIELFAGTTDPTFKLASGPKRLERMIIDTVEIVHGDELTLSIGAETRMRDQGRPRIRRYTDAEQQRRFPGDRFFEYLPSLQEVSIPWGRS